MATDLQSPSEPQLANLVGGILNDAQELFKQQIALVRHEVKEDFRKSKEAAVPLGLGLWLAGVGSVLLGITLALILAEIGLPLWAGFAVVGAVVFLAGAGLFYVGKQKFQSFNPLPDQSAKALEENLEWITKPK